MAPIRHNQNTTDCASVIPVKLFLGTIPGGRLGRNDIPVEDAAKSNEQPDDDGRRGGACHMLGLLDHEPHGDNVYVNTDGGGKAGSRTKRGNVSWNVDRAGTKHVVRE